MAEQVLLSLYPAYELKNADVRISLAQIAERKGRRDEAERLYREAVSRCERAGPSVHLAGFYMRRDLLDDALAVLERATHPKEGDAAEVHFNIARIKRARLDFAAAAESYRRAIEADSDYPLARRELADLERANAFGDADT